MALHLLCKLDEIPDCGGREFLVGGRVVAAFRVDGRVLAVDGMCAHQGGPLAQGKLDDKCVTCPWHGWQYDISTGCNLLTNKKMLDTFPTKTLGDEIWIDV